MSSQISNSALNVTIGEPAFMTSFQIPGSVSATALVNATLADFNETTLTFDQSGLALQAGTSSPLTLTLTNIGSNNLNNGFIELNFPAGVSPVFVANPVYTFVQQLDGSWLITFTNPVLPDESVDIVMQLDVAPGTPNTAGNIAAEFIANGVLIDSATLDVLIGDGSSGLFLVHQVDKNVVESDEAVRYTLNVTNQLPVDVNAVYLTDVLPSGIRYLGGTATINNIPVPDPVLSEDGRTLVFNLGTLAADKTAIVSYGAYITAMAHPGILSSFSIAQGANAISNKASVDVLVRQNAINVDSHVVGRVLADSCSDATKQAVGNLKMRLRSQLIDDYVLYTVTVNGSKVPVEHFTLMVNLPEALDYIDDTTWIDGELSRNPKNDNGQLLFDLGDQKGKWQHELSFKVKPRADKFGRYETGIYAVYDVEDKGSQTSPVLVNSYEATAEDKHNSGNSIILGEESVVLAGVYNENTYKQHKESKHSKGLPGVRLIMEDGRFVDTDEEGRYHFEGLKPGTHVIQIDPKYIPEGYEPYLCGANTRFTRTPTSQFVDVQKGLVWRANFHLRRIKHSTFIETVTKLNSELNGKTLHYTLLVDGIATKNAAVNVVLGLPSAIMLDKASVTVNGKPVTAGIQGQQWMIALPLSDSGSQQELAFTAQLNDRMLGEYTTAAHLHILRADGTVHKTRTVTNQVKVEQPLTNVERYDFATLFAPGSTVLTRADMNELDKVALRFKGKAIENIEIIAHTDNLLLFGDAKEKLGNNDNLSRLRAAEAGNYLAGQLKLAEGRIRTTGKGAQQAIASNYTDEGRARNRRMEIYVAVRQEGAPVVSTLSKPESIRHVEVIELPEGRETVVSDSPVTATATSVPDGILSVKNGDIVPASSMSVRTSLDSRLSQILYIDGREVPSSRIGFRQADTKTNKTLSTYFGVNLGEAGEHELHLKGVDPFGNVRFEQRVKFIRSGDIREINFISAEGNIADGKSPVAVQLELIDQYGKKISASTDLVIMSGELQPYEESTTDKIPLVKDSNKMVSVSKEGIVRFKAVTQSGLYRTKLRYNDVETDLKIYVKPEYRDWVMVGVADGTVGYENVSGNMKNLADNDIEEEYYGDGKLAFYAKGRVLGKYLLTVAFDSSKASVEDERLLQLINPDEYYTLYGDNTEQLYDAASREKLYLRLDADKFYVLFGDYNTDLTVTELSRYARSLTGVKGVYESEHASVDAFAAQTSQLFTRDEILGDGTSGLYRLSRKNIVVNSEQVTIQVRDRFHSSRIISEQKLNRFSDYNLDYADGSLYFKQPIARHDENFNPVYIIAEYEAQGSGKEGLVGGGRAAVKFLDETIELGVTHVNEDIEGAEGQLTGIDTRYDITKELQFKAEYATTEKSLLATTTDADAYLAELTHRSKKFETSVYVREEDPGFGLGQLSPAETGLRKYGTQGTAIINEDMKIIADLGHEDNKVDASDRNFMRSNFMYTPEDWEFNLGATIANDTDNSGNEYKSEMLNTGVARKLLDDRLRLYNRSEWLLNSNQANVDFPERHIFGSDYMLTEDINIYSEYEFAKSDIIQSESTRAGLRSRPWANATMNNGVQHSTSDIDARTFAVFGLTQAVPFSENWRASFTYDQTETIDRKLYNRVNENIPLASGSTNTMLSTNGELDEDFWATTAGVGYQSSVYLFDSRIEYRETDNQQKYGFFTGWQRNLIDGIGHALRFQTFLVNDALAGDQLDSELRYSTAIRPLGSDVFWFNRTEIKQLDMDGLLNSSQTNKFVEHLAINYLPTVDWQIAMHIGYKLTRSNLGQKTFTTDTFLLGNETRYDLTPRWDIGAHYHILTTPDMGLTQDSYGLSVGVDVAKNLWLSMGFNAEGYTDEDFDANGYTAKGPYLKLRFKFDQDTFKLND